MNQWLWLLVLLIGCSDDLPGLEKFPSPERGHGLGAIAYPLNPPVGGKHNVIWQNCGVYDAPVNLEFAVHSLEHGAVWLTYRPDVTRAEVLKLRALVRGRRQTLVSPYRDSSLTAPIYAVAWGLRLGVSSANDSRLPRFLARYENGPQTPELGASCFAGIGKPRSNP